MVCHDVLGAKIYERIAPRAECLGGDEPNFVGAAELVNIFWITYFTVNYHFCLAKNVDATFDGLLEILNNFDFDIGIEFLKLGQTSFCPTDLADMCSLTVKIGP